MDYILTCLVVGGAAGIVCAAVGGLECGLAAVIIGAVVVRVAHKRINGA